MSDWKRLQNISPSRHLAISCLLAALADIAHGVGQQLLSLHIPGTRITRTFPYRLVRFRLVHWVILSPFESISLVTYLVRVNLVPHSSVSSANQCLALNSIALQKHRAATRCLSRAAMCWKTIRVVSGLHWKLKVSGKADSHESNSGWKPQREVHRKQQPDARVHRKHKNHKNILIHILDRLSHIK